MNKNEPMFKTASIDIKLINFLPHTMHTMATEKLITHTLAQSTVTKHIWNELNLAEYWRSSSPVHITRCYDGKFVYRLFRSGAWNTCTPKAIRYFIKFKVVYSYSGRFLWLEPVVLPYFPMEEHSSRIISKPLHATHRQNSIERRLLVIFLNLVLGHAPGKKTNKTREKKNPIIRLIQIQRLMDDLNGKLEIRNLDKVLRMSLPTNGFQVYSFIILFMFVRLFALFLSLQVLSTRYSLFVKQSYREIWTRHNIRIEACKKQDMI